MEDRGTLLGLAVTVGMVSGPQLRAGKELSAGARCDPVRAWAVGVWSRHSVRWEVARLLLCEADLI